MKYTIVMNKRRLIVFEGSTRIYTSFFETVYRDVPHSRIKSILLQHTHLEWDLTLLEGII